MTRSQESQHNVVDFGYAKLTNAKFARSMVNSIRAIEVRCAIRTPHKCRIYVGGNAAPIHAIAP